MDLEHATDHGPQASATQPLAPVFEPRRIAVVGASASPEKRGHQILKALIEGDFSGEVIPVNPRGGNILGIDVVRSIAEIEHPVDLAVVALPASSAVEAVSAAAEAGVRAVVVLAVGFGESGAEGAEREARLRSIVRESKLRLVGPNTSGVFNAHAGLNVIGTPNVARGAVSILTQSGNVALALMRGLTASGVGVSTCLGVGNQLDVGFGEAMDFLAYHDATQAVVLYAEEFAGGPLTLDACARAAARLPVIALKGGRTTEGAQVAASHTGALASPYAVLAAALTQIGVTVTTREDELVPLGSAMATQPADGRGAAILSDGGGQATHVVDALAQKGTALARLSRQTQEALRRLLGPAAAIQNPVDLAGSADADPSVFAEALRVLMADPAVGPVLVVGLFGGYHLRFAESLLDAETAAAQSFVAHARSTGKPLVVHTMYAEAAGSALDPLRRAGIPVLGSIDVAASVVHALQQRGRFLREGEHPRASGLLRLGADRMMTAEIRRVLGEWEARHELSASDAGAGVPFVEARLCRTPAEVSNAVRTLSNGRGDDVRYVLKAHGAGLGHKTESGGVVLDVPTAEAPREAEGLLARLPDVSGVLVQPMMSAPLAELLMAVRVDDTVGLVATVGAGGVWTEVLDDVAHILMPFRTGAVVDAVGALRIAPRLEGARGRDAVSLEVLRSVEALVGRLGDWMVARQDVLEVELNPLFVYSDRIVAVDALLVRSEGPRQAPGVA